jgi:predicted acetyltransferase
MSGLVMPSGLIARDGELSLVLTGLHPPDEARGWVPYYAFVIAVGGVPAGTIRLRIGDEPDLVLYGGHVGYDVLPAFRGRHYAERACRLLFPLMRANGQHIVWITCNPDNQASRRTCERLGAEFVEIIDLPTDSDMYLRGERQKCRYRLVVPAEAALSRLI